MKESFSFGSEENKESAEHKFDEEYCASFFEYSKIPGTNKEISIMRTLHAPGNKDEKNHRWLLKTGYQQLNGNYQTDSGISEEISFEEGIEILKKYGYSKNAKDIFLTKAAKEALGVEE